MEAALWIFGVYLVVGVGITGLLSQTPYADNPWWITILLWPLFLYALVVG